MVTFERLCCIRAYHMDSWNTGSGSVGLGKLPSRKFCLKYLSNPYTVIKKKLCLLSVLNKKCHNEVRLIVFTTPLFLYVKCLWIQLTLKIYYC